MSDDKTKTGWADRIRINIHEEYELGYWSAKLKCSREALIEAARAVGPMAEDIKAYIDEWGPSGRNK